MAAHRVGTLAELSDAGRIIVEIEGRSIGVFEVDGDVFALRNRCPHQGGPLCEGKILPALRARLDDRRRPVEFYAEDQMVICCPYHGIEFDMRTGVSLADPKLRVRSYETIVENGDVFVVAASTP